MQRCPRCGDATGGGREGVLTAAVLAYNRHYGDVRRVRFPRAVAHLPACRGIYTALEGTMR